MTFTTALPAPQRLFFTLLDFEFDAERAHIAGFNGTTVVIPTVFSRAEAARTGVVIDPAPRRWTIRPCTAARGWIWSNRPAGHGC